MATARNADRLLEVENLDVSYGPIQVVWDITLSVRRGEVMSLIGPNGAGKTTTLRALAGILPTRKGKISFDAHDITPDPPHRRVGHHLNLVPEGRQLWPRMTVEENLLMGAFSSNLRPKSHQNLERIYGLFPRLKERHKQLCGTLSGADHGGPSLRADMQNRQGWRHDSACGAKCQLCAADFQSHVCDGMGEGAARGTQRNFARERPRSPRVSGRN